MKNVLRLTLAVIAMFLVMAFTSINAIRFTEPSIAKHKTCRDSYGYS